MATIQAHILASQQQQQEPEQSIAGPGATLDLPGTASPENIEPPRLTHKQEDILAAQEKLLGSEEAERLRQEQEQEASKSRFVKTSERAIKKSGELVHGADVRIGALPQPGSIVFPLVVLLLLFFILIQVGGYSRIQWLWLVLSGQAQVGTALMTVPTEGAPEGNPSPFNPGGNLTGGAGGSDLLSNLQVRPFLPANGMYPVNGVY